jgi:hypothetical protein
MREVTRIRSVVVGLLVVALYGSIWPRVVVAQGERPCDIQALSAVDQLTDWNGLYDEFKRYGHCDDGALDEGWSDVVVRLLTQDWKTVSVLSRLAAADTKFSDFVLQHVDELMSPDEARTIVVNARTKCPRNADKLCHALAEKADRTPE